MKKFLASHALSLEPTEKNNPNDSNRPKEVKE